MAIPQKFGLPIFQSQQKTMNTQNFLMRKAPTPPINIQTKLPIQILQDQTKQKFSEVIQKNFKKKNNKQFIKNSQDGSNRQRNMENIKKRKSPLRSFSPSRSRSQSKDI